MTANIHQGLPVLNFGAEVSDTRLLVILLHGRGATAESMLPLAEMLSMEGIRFEIPQAALNRWYPQSAFGPIEANEPDLSSALGVVASLVKEARVNVLSDQQIVLGGFSQGACLASEYVARHPRKYAGLFIFSGALIGPPGTSRSYSGSFSNMPVFIGGSDVDPWVAHDLIKGTAGVFEKMGADVDFRTYPGMGHTVNQDEVDRVRKMFTGILAE
ncbi:MAG: alpha/beta hydrolase [Anaerolineales bacterium]|jgi:predicted esterase